MPEETGRTTKRKRIVFPGEDPNDPNAAGVNVPVITRINFIDPVNRAQEYQYTIDNSASADRTVHVDKVYSDGDTNGEPLQVERIDVWRTVDPVARAQETQVSFDNVTGNDTNPPRFTTHRKTHVVRYKNDPDDGNWIDSELIDELDVVDPVNRGQETIVTLLNPQGTFDEEGKEVLTANTSDPEISDTANGIDPAWRTDPFQNIIDWSAGYYLLIQFFWQDRVTSNLGERGTLTNNMTPSWTFTAGIQSTIIPASNIDVQYTLATGDVTADMPTLNEPAIVTHNENAQGYPKFLTCEVIGAGNYQAEINYPFSDPNKPIGFPEPPCWNDTGEVRFAADVPFTSYVKAFLFDISPTAKGSVDPAELEFEAANIPSPTRWHYLARNLPIYPGYVHPTDDPTKEDITNGTTNFRFETWVFRKSQVDVHLTDTEFPLRVKGNTGSTVNDTKAVFYSRSFMLETGGWIDVQNQLHETFSDDESTPGTGTFGTGKATHDPGTGVQHVKIRFETFNDLGDTSEQVSKSIAWPKDPPVLIVEGHDPLGSTPTGGLHVRQYLFATPIPGPSGGDIDFGDPPDESSA